MNSFGKLAAVALLILAFSGETEARTGINRSGASAELPLGEVQMGFAEGARSAVRVASNGDGYVVIWVDHRSPQRMVFARRLAGDGSPLETVGRPIARVIGDATIASDRDGYLIAFACSRDEYGRGSETCLAGINRDGSVSYPTSRYPGGDPRIVSNGSSYLLITTEVKGDGYTGDDYTLRAQLVTNRGDAMSNAREIHTRRIGGLVAAASGSDYYIVWEPWGPGQSGLLGCRITADGAVGDVSRITTEPLASGEQFDIAGFFGRFAVVFANAASTLRYVEIDGAAVSLPRSLDQRGDEPGIAALADGSWAVTYTFDPHALGEPRSPDSSTEVRLLRVRDDAVTAPTLVARRITPRDGADVASGASGVLIAWRDFAPLVNAGAAGENVASRAVSLLDELGPVHIVSRAVRSQQQHAVATSPSGDRAHVWQEFVDEEGHSQVFLQIANDLETTSMPVRVEPSTQRQFYPAVAVGNVAIMTMWLERVYVSQTWQAAVVAARLFDRSGRAISDRIVIDEYADNTSSMAVGYDGEGFLLAWATADGRIAGRRVGERGELGPAHYVTPARGWKDSDPQLIWNGSEYLLLWASVEEHRCPILCISNPPGASVMAISRHGDALAERTVISERHFAHRAAWNGSEYAIIAALPELTGTRVDRLGRRLDPQNRILASDEYVSSVDVAWDGKAYVLSWSRHSESEPTPPPGGG
jgi:hypothetical protein